MRPLFVAYALAVALLGGLGGWWWGVLVLPEHPLTSPALLVIGWLVGDVGHRIWSWSQRP